MDLITTAYNGRLRKGLSHPVGAEIMSSALSGVPQWSELELCFNAIPNSSMGLFTPGDKLHYLRGKVGQEFLSYTELLYCGYWDPGFWTIGTFPVASSDRSQARTIFRDVALPRLRAWLSEERPEPWLCPQRVLQFGLSKDWSELGILETHNDRVVCVKKVPTGTQREEPPNKS